MSGESNYSWTTKINGDLFTVRGDTYDEFAEHVRAVVDGNLSSMIHALSMIQAAGNAAPLVNADVPAAAFVPTVVPPVAAPPQSAWNNTPVAPPAYGEAPAPTGAAPLCEHGQPAKLIAGGISKSTGKPYRSFWACAQPRQAQCNFRATA